MNSMSAVVTGLSLSALLVAVSPASAQYADTPVPKAAKIVISAQDTISGKSVIATPMAEWDVGKNRILIAENQPGVDKAPANASRYLSKRFVFPTGTIRELTFTKAGGGMLHQITSETEIYVLKGSGEVTVGTEKVSLTAGDAVYLPTGVLRSKEGMAEDTVIIAFTVYNNKPNAKASVIYGKDTPSTALASGPKASTAATKTSVARYAFDGNSIRVATLTNTGKKPGKTTPYTGDTDALIYIASGRLKIALGKTVTEVVAGDVVREAAGVPNYWEVLEESQFIATTAVTVKDLKTVTSAPQPIPVFR